MLTWVSFQQQLQQRIVSEWKEKSRTKIFYGVKSEHYKAFLDNFCKSAQLDKKLRKDFEQLQDTLEKIGENKKTFSLKNTATTGTYGMYVAVKDPATVAPHHKSSIQQCVRGRTM